jgi:hypothetical protein
MTVGKLMSRECPEMARFGTVARELAKRTHRNPTDAARRKRDLQKRTQFERLGSKTWILQNKRNFAASVGRA